MDRRDGLVVAGLGAVLITWLLPAVNYGVDAHHDGIMLKPALDVLAGQSLFRDTFTHYGALTTYLQAAAMWFQPTLLAVRVLTAGAHVVTLFFLYAAWRHVLPRSLAALSCGLFILFVPVYEKDWLNDYWMLMPWSSTYALMFQSVGLYALLRMIQGNDPVRWAALLGAACGCVFWCRMPVGVTMTGGLVIIWLALGWTRWEPAGTSRKKILIGLILGLGVVHGLMLFNLLLTGALREWWYQIFIWPRKWVQLEVGLTWQQFVTIYVHPLAAFGLLAVPAALLGWRRLNPTPTHRPAWIIPSVCLVVVAIAVWQHDWALRALSLRGGGWTALLPLVVLILSAMSLGPVIRRRAQAQPTEYYLVAAWTVLSLASLPQYYPLPDPWHILWSAAPAFGLLALLFWRWSGWSASVTTAVLVVAFVPAAYTKVVSFNEAGRQPWVTLEAPGLLRGMKVRPQVASLYGQVAQTLSAVQQRRPNLPAVMIGHDAIYLCFFSNRANPLPYFVNWPNLTSPADEQQRWLYIHEQRPLIFFQSAPNWPAVGDFYRREHYVPLHYINEAAVEIAVPKEVADEMGVTSYGKPITTEPTHPPTGS